MLQLSEQKLARFSRYTLPDALKNSLGSAGSPLDALIRPPRAVNSIPKIRYPAMSQQAVTERARTVSQPVPQVAVSLLPVAVSLLSVAVSLLPMAVSLLSVAVSLLPVAVSLLPGT